MSQSVKDIQINKAISLFNEGNVKKSLKEAVVAKKKYPNEPFIYNLLGVLYAEMESYTDSIENYSKAIKLNPKYFEAYNNVGVAYTSCKKINKAIEFFNRALELNPSYAEAYNNRGNAFKEKEEFHLALESYKKSIQINPNFIDAISNAGIVYDIMDNFTKAEMYFKKAVSLDPTNTSLLFKLSNCLYNSKDYERAIDVCRKIINLDPSFYYAYNRMGMCCIKLDMEDEAKKFFEKSININPDYAEGLTNYGLILQKSRNFALASAQFKKALSINPNSDEALLNLSKAYFDEGRLSKSIEVAKKGLSFKRLNIPLLKILIASYLLLNMFDEAMVVCKKILSVDENDADAINLMGTIFEKKGFYNEAKNHFLRAIELDKNLVLAKINIANLYQLEGKIQIADKIYNNLLKEHPKSLDAIYRQSGFALMLGRFEEGWKKYEYRWKVFPMNKVVWPFQDKPLWNGEKGKRVVLWKEQGIGDQIIFLGLALEVKEMCETLTVEVDPRLQSLCRRAMPEINFVIDNEATKNVECDYHIPLGSVPGLLRDNIRDFDRTVNGYLRADPERVEAIRTELSLDGKTAIGISWRSFNSLTQTKKSVQLLELEQIFTGLDVVLVNLQYGDVEDEIREFKEATGIDVIQCASVDNREDIDGLAALIELCDLVVSIDNATVHLAGALAKKTWVMLNFVPIYYWLLDRPDSIWYPSVSLYRQPTLNDWDSVYVSIRTDLLSKLSKKNSSIK